MTRIDQRLLCALLIAVVSVAAPAAFGRTRTHDLYRIVAAWFDSEQVYVLFEKDLIRVTSSAKDREGTPHTVQSQRAIWTVGRLQVAQGLSTEIRQSLEVSSQDIYSDRSIRLRREGDGVLLTFRDGGRVLLPAFRYGSRPVLTSERVAYSGSIVDLRDRSLTAVPSAVMQAIDEDCQASKAGSSLSLPATPIHVIASNELLVTCAASWMSSDTVWATRWVIGEESYRKIKLPLPIGASAYTVVPSSVTYSPSRVLLRSSEMPGLLACNAHDCRRIDDPGAYTYMLVDESADTVVIVTQPSMTSPRVNVRSARLRPL